MWPNLPHSLASLANILPPASGPVPVNLVALLYSFVCFPNVSEYISSISFLTKSGITFVVSSNHWEKLIYPPLSVGTVIPFSCSIWYIPLTSTSPSLAPAIKAENISTSVVVLSVPSAKSKPSITLCAQLFWFSLAILNSSITFCGSLFISSIAFLFAFVISIPAKTSAFALFTSAWPSIWAVSPTLSPFLEAFLDR